MSPLELAYIKAAREGLQQPVEKNTIGLPAPTSRLHSPEVVHANARSVLALEA
jgi:hypothetical protein